MAKGISALQVIYEISRALRAPLERATWEDNGGTSYDPWAAPPEVWTPIEVKRDFRALLPSADRRDAARIAILSDHGQIAKWVIPTATRDETLCQVLDTIHGWKAKLGIYNCLYDTPLLGFEKGGRFELYGKVAYDEERGPSLLNGGGEQAIYGPLLTPMCGLGARIKIFSDSFEPEDYLGLVEVGSKAVVLFGGDHGEIFNLGAILAKHAGRDVSVVIERCMKPHISWRKKRMDELYFDVAARVPLNKFANINVGG